MADDGLEAQKLPPQAIEAEMAVLGSMMLDKQAAGTVFEVLDVSCFYRQAHQKIFSTGLNLYKQNEPIDILTIASELQKKQELEEVGGEFYLTELVERIPSAANAENYCRIVLDRALLRKLIAVTNTIQQECYESAVAASELLDQAEARIFNLGQQHERRDFVDLSSVLFTTMKTYESFHGLKSGITGIATGYHNLDQMLSGMQKSELIILAARPSMGKTALALNIAVNAAKTGKSVGIFSLEMSAVQLAMRLLCSDARVNSHSARTGRLPDSEWARLGMVAGHLSQLKLFIDDSPGLTVMELRSKARRLHYEHNVELLVIDYLQLLRGSGRYENRQIEIAGISQALKSLAKEMEIPVLALSQLSRAVEARTGERRPMLSDLRESGAIEQDADVVLFINRPSVYLAHGQTDSPQDDKKAEIIIAKQRNGPVGSVELNFIRDFVRFENISPQDATSSVDSNLF
ncbi:MAG TPA: replicative DNA helicase [bacterium]|nr:replicative DNA helicase [bacterium]HNT65215.1 replicative DNA helicase [bacterium]HOX86982.1 replicative DNA helicase [bacterium]HPG46313.1 replicative DNA helicase [bacterium]HPM98493.1 replicative DNA helicase [bacterium]